MLTFRYDLLMPLHTKDENLMDVVQNQRLDLGNLWDIHTVCDSGTADLMICESWKGGGGVLEEQGALYKQKSINRVLLLGSVKEGDYATSYSKEAFCLFEWTKHPPEEAQIMITEIYAECRFWHMSSNFVWK